MTNNGTPIPPQIDGKWWPYCTQTETGGCLVDNLDQWAQIGEEAAEAARAEIGSVDDSTAIIQAGRNAARISKDAQDLAAESGKVEL